MNADTLVKYLATIVQGYRWSADPANRSAVVTILARHLKITNDLAANTVELEVGSNGGLAKDAGFDVVGFKTR